MGLAARIIAQKEAPPVRGIKPGRLSRTTAAGGMADACDGGDARVGHGTWEVRCSTEDYVEQKSCVSLTRNEVELRATFTGVRTKDERGSIRGPG